MRVDYRAVAFAACVTAWMGGAPVAKAQVATTLEQAELAGLSAAKGPRCRPER
jgi:hypothetical protein